MRQQFLGLNRDLILLSHADTALDAHYMDIAREPSSWSYPTFYVVVNGVLKSVK